MRRVVAGPEIERLIQLLSKLPGLGPRSARRAALHLVKKREELMQPLTAVVPLQLFACELATLMDHDVDQPRNLAKSVTVE